MHTSFMLSALEQAYLGRGVCAPNPAVGAVLVQGNRMIARAYHAGAGSAHAEQLVLESAPEGLEGATLYVTLEPCNHWGRTPPCVAAIIKAGIRCVVYGFRDPNPIVAANNTPLILQEQGIEVIHWPLAEIDAFYLSYNHWTQTKMPWVTAKIAQSLDGKIADANGPVALSNESCRQFTHTQRLYTDIIVTTAKTLIADNAALNVRLDGKEPIKKPVAIIDARLTTPLDAQIFTTATHCHIYYDASLQVMHTKPNVSYWPIPATAGRLHLEAVLKHLGEQGYHDVWVEAGGTLFTELHTRGLVQTTYIYVVPKVLGPTAPSAYLDAGMLNRPYTMSWHTKDDNIIGCMQALTTLA